MLILLKRWHEDSKTTKQKDPKTKKKKKKFKNETLLPLMSIILSYHNWGITLAQATKEEKMFSGFSYPKRKIPGEILLESPKPIPVLKKTPKSIPVHK
jgi:hypothetical protein